MKFIRIFAYLSVTLLLGACWSAEQKPALSGKPDTSVNEQETPDQTDNSENPDTSEPDDPATETKGTSGAADENTETPPARPAGPLSPTQTLKEFDAATNAQDYERIKRVLTKDSIRYFETEAKKRGMTFKQLVEQPKEMPTVETPEMRNEKINGNRATVEAKNRFLGTFDKYPLVKEDGVWKVAYDVYTKQKIEEINKIANQ